MLSHKGFRKLAKKCLYEGVILPTEYNRAETRGMTSSERTTVNVLDMKYLRSSVRVLRTDRVWNEEVRIEFGIERELGGKATNDHSR